MASSGSWERQCACFRAESVASVPEFQSECSEDPRKVKLQTAATAERR